MGLTIAVDVLVLAWILYRQVKVRRVRPHLTLRLPVVLAVVGVIELVSYTGSHHVPAGGVGVLALSFVVGAVVLGAVRAATVKLWRVEGLVLRQGTWLTIALWLVSITLHYGAQGWITSLHGPGGIVSASLLLWLGVTYGVQTAVVHRRAEGLLAQAGEAIDARSEVVDPGGWWGVTWMRGGGPGGPGGGAPGGAREPRPSHPDAIEASAEPLPPPARPAPAPERGTAPERGPAGRAGGPGPDRPPGSS
jgi:hypothetical protein